jgi:NADH:ubiquinone oxidoreductase subunit E
MSDSFEFTAENQTSYNEIITRYESKYSALLPVLHLAQKQNGWISGPVIAHISNLMGIPGSKIKEVVTHHEMLYDKPIGRNVVRVCTSVTCSMFGARDTYRAILEKYDLLDLGTTKDGRVTVQKVQCLGACEMAPSMQVNDTNYGRLSTEKAIQKIEELA